MVYLIVILFSFISLGCSQKNQKPEYDIKLYGAAELFTEVRQNALYGTPSIENSLLNVHGEIVAMHDPYIDGSLYMSRLTNDLGAHSAGKVMSDARFSYVMEHGGLYYNFVLRSGDIYAFVSRDLKSWRVINAGAPVLSRSTDSESIYYNLWNVGVAVDDSGVWHMLAETAPSGYDQAGVGLAYMTATLNDETLNFDATKTNTHVIPRGGNPYLVNVPGRGIMALHGHIIDRAFDLDGYWFVTASTLQNGAWTTHLDRFAIGTPGLAICDPHMAASDGQLVLSMSVAQDSVTIARGAGTIEQLFDDLAR